MSKRSRKILFPIVAVVAAIVAVVTIPTIGLQLIGWIKDLDPNTRTAVLALVGVVSVPLITLFTQMWFEKRRSREEAIREKRTNFYEKLVEFFMSTVGAGSNGRGVKSNTTKMAQGFNAMVPEMITYASPETMRAWALLRKVGIDSQTTIENDGAETQTRYMVASMEIVLRSVRQDLGHKVTKPDFGDAIATWINDLDYEAVAKAQKDLKNKYPRYFIK